MSPDAKHDAPAEQASGPDKAVRLAGLAMQLAAARRAGDLPRLAPLLRECLAASQRAGGEEVGSNPALLSAMEQLGKEICDSLAALGSLANLDRTSTGKSQLIQLRHLLAEARQSFGLSALCLSGGGMLGLYHLGVVKCVFDMGILPNNICGTSVGAILASFVATHTDEELRKELTRPETLFRILGPQQGPFLLSYWRCAWNFARQGFMFDHRDFEHQCQVVSRSLTFAEAFARTGRTLTITCTPAEGGPVLLLNRHTAPRVLIASAICASCAMPFLVEAVPLFERSPDGSVRPWSARPVGSKFRDGTLSADVPRAQLQEQLNVQFATVSQVNPHVVPFAWPRRAIRRFVEGEAGRRFCGVGRALAAAEAWLRGVFWTLLFALQAITGLPRPGGWLDAIIFQDYSTGDVNVLHTEMRVIDYYRSLKNERTIDDFMRKIEAARQETACHTTQLTLRARVEEALRHVFHEVASPLGRGRRARKQWHRRTARRLTSAGKRPAGVLQRQR